MSMPSKVIDPEAIGHLDKLQVFFAEISDSPDVIRTRDRRIRNPLLYPAELRGRCGNSSHFHCQTTTPSLAACPSASA